MYICFNLEYKSENVSIFVFCEKKVIFWENANKKLK